MRIALYHCRLPQAGTKPGGVEIFVDRLGQALVGRGHDVVAFTFAAPTDPRSYETRVLRPELAATSKFVRQYVAPWLLNVRPFDGGFDVAHLHGDDWFYLRRRVPTVRTFYGSALLEALNATSSRRRLDQTVVFALEQLAARQADATYGIGPESQMLHTADGILACGVPQPDGNRPARETRPTILFIGTWEGRKRGSLLHRTFQDEVLPAIPDAQLWMVSDRADPAPNVTWFPTPTDAEVQDLLARSWTFCLPSTYEGLGMPYLEAMAHGTPVVATPNPGAREVLVNGQHGLIVEPAGLGEALVRSLRDDQLRDALRARGLARADDFRWERLLEAYEDAYALAISRWDERRARRRPRAR